MNSTERDLAPCPFCGGEVFVQNRGWEANTFVRCPGCKTQWCLDDGSPRATDATIAAWNRRTPADALASIRAERDMAERAAVEAAIPLEALLMAGQGPLSDAVWDGVRNGVGHVRSMLKARAARTIAGEQKND